MDDDELSRAVMGGVGLLVTLILYLTYSIISA